jgi:hypothetical protein
MITIGRPVLALKQAQQWAQRHGSEVALWRGGGLYAALDGVGAALAGRTSSKQAALARILPASNGPANAVWVALDLEHRERLLAAAAPAGAEREALARIIEGAPSDSDWTWTEERFAALSQIVPVKPSTLLFCWVEPFHLAALSWVGSFLDAAPFSLVVLASGSQSRAAIDAALRSDDRTVALIGERIILESAGNDGERVREPATDFEADVLRLAAAEELMSGGTSPCGIHDSAAEAFLAQVLETHPGTARLFTAQGRPGFAMAGGQAARVDFLAASLRIAIEVDGPHHLEPAQYRRDRHKDLELQARGYVVLRFLAEDIVTDVERVRATVIRVVHARLCGATEFPV